jgi:hypothetical protein
LQRQIAVRNASSKALPTRSSTGTLSVLVMKRLLLACSEAKKVDRLLLI